MIPRQPNVVVGCQTFHVYQCRNLSNLEITERSLAESYTMWPYQSMRRVSIYWTETDLRTLKVFMIPTTICITIINYPSCRHSTFKQNYFRSKLEITKWEIPRFCTNRSIPVALWNEIPPSKLVAGHNPYHRSSSLVGEHATYKLKYQYVEFNKLELTFGHVSVTVV